MKHFTITLAPTVALETAEAVCLRAGGMPGWVGGRTISVFLPSAVDAAAEQAVHNLAAAEEGGEYRPALCEYQSRF
jgi:hypothetical protein